MISVGSRDGRKGLGLALEMEETELEEGEALNYNDGNEDSTIDPDIALSYIEEKLQNVLGHFQKDFEGGVSAENLGAKFGGYGSFLPTYQRSPSWSHSRSQSEVHNIDSPKSPRKMPLEDRRQSSLASSSASPLGKPSAKPAAASGKFSSVSNSSKSDVCIPSRDAEEYSTKGGVVAKSVNPSDQRTFKLRIKVGSENLPTQKNAEIYSGLGLVVSPSSSLDDSPAASEGLCGKLLEAPEESPTSILEIMTSLPREVLLSPLSESLIHLSDKRKPVVKNESEFLEKTGRGNSGMLANGSHLNGSKQKATLRPSVKDDGLSRKLSYQGNYGDQDSTSSLSKKEKEADIDTLGCEELLSNALKLPLLSRSQYTPEDPAKVIPSGTTVPVIDSKDGVKGETFSEVAEKERLDGDSVKDNEKLEREKLSSSSKISESKKGNLVNRSSAYSQQNVLKASTPHATDQADSNVSRGRKTLSVEPTDPLKQSGQKGESGYDESLNPAFENSSTGSKRKPKGVHSLGSQRVHIPKDQADSSVTSKRGKSTHANGISSKTDSHGFQKDHEKHGDRYKDLFGDVEFEEDDNESISGEMTSSGKLKNSQNVGKRSLKEHHSTSNEKCNVKNFERPHGPGKHAMEVAHVAPPPGNGPTEAPTGMGPLLNEEWVFCDKCGKWRLLPPGMNPKSFPDKWVCRMITWLPGMNRCNIPEDVTTSALRSLYHPAVPVPAPTSENQHDLLNNSVPTSVGVTSVDSRNGQEHQNIAVQTPRISGKKKHGSTNATSSTDLDGSTHSSESRKKYLPTSCKNNDLNGGNLSPLLDACGYQHSQQTPGDIEKHHDGTKDKKVSLVSCSDKGTNLKIRNKRESDFGGSRVSKKIRGEELHDGENWASDNGEAFSKADHGSTSGLANNTPGNGRGQYTNDKDSRVDAKNNKMSAVNLESDDGKLHSGKSDNKKRKYKEYSGSQIHTKPLSSSGRRHQDSGDFTEVTCENGPRKEKKARVSAAGVKDTSGSKASVGSDKKSRNTKEQHNGQYLGSNLTADYSKGDMVSMQQPVAANSSSSKVSGSHKNKTTAEDVKGSPVESVSSSPLRLSNIDVDKLTSAKRALVQKDGFHDPVSMAAGSSRRFSGGEDDGENDRKVKVKKNSDPTVNDRDTDTYNDHVRQNDQHAGERRSSDQSLAEEKINTHKSQNIGSSHSKKSSKGSTSHFTDKDRSSGSDLDKHKAKAPDFPDDALDHVQLLEEKSKSRRSKLDEKSGTPRRANKSVVKKDAMGGTLGEDNRGQSKKESRSHDGKEVSKNQDKKNNIGRELDNEILPKKNHIEVIGSKKSHSLPPLAKGQTETVASLPPDSGSQKQSGVKVMAVEGPDNGDSLKVPTQSNKAENQNGQLNNLRHPTPNLRKVRDVEAPSPVRRDSSSHAANSALKEAKDLKHLADRYKNNGSSESIGYYFQAALKFLHGASLLESGSSEGTKQNDMAHSMHIYSSTAKLCEFCAHEYEKLKDMAAAALAYKCTEVAYMRVVYSSHSNASRDRNELQTALQIVPPGESPSSSASDVDNLNHPANTEKAPLTKVIDSPQVSGSHIITSRNRTSFVRLLNFAQDVSFTMEASRKSRIALSSATSRLRDTSHREGINSLRKALDFNFHDVEGLLRLVRIAMEAIGR